MNSIPKHKVSLCEPQLPPGGSMPKDDLVPMSSVCIFRVVSKIPTPLADVPAPRYNCMLYTLETKSLIFTQKRVALSASFIGIPLAVIFAHGGSMLYTRSEVYPIPLSVSEAGVIDGNVDNRNEISLPWFIYSTRSCDRSECVIGVFLLAWVRITCISCNP